jgi:hypothetical protein
MVDEVMSNKRSLDAAYNDALRRKQAKEWRIEGMEIFWGMRPSLLQCPPRRDAANLTNQLTYGSMMAAFPPLRRPKPEIADPGTVRLGSGCSAATGFDPTPFLAT